MPRAVYLHVDPNWVPSTIRFAICPVVAELNKLRSEMYETKILYWTHRVSLGEFNEVWGWLSISSHPFCGNNPKKQWCLFWSCGVMSSSFFQGREHDPWSWGHASTKMGQWSSQSDAPVAMRCLTSNPESRIINALKELVSDTENNSAFWNIHVSHFYGGKVPHNPDAY